MWVLQYAVSMDTTFMRKSIASNTRLITRNINLKSIAGKASDFPCFRKIKGACQLIFFIKVFGLLNSQNRGYQIGIASTLADAVKRGVDIGILTAVDSALGARDGVGHGHAQVSVAVQFNGHADTFGQ